MRSDEKLSPTMHVGNATFHTLSPVIVERYIHSPNHGQTAHRPEKGFSAQAAKNSQRQEEKEAGEPDNDLMMREGRKDLESPSLTESVASDKDEGRETETKPCGRSTASLERITVVKHSLTLDIPTAQTNHCFSLDRKSVV